VNNDGGLDILVTNNNGSTRLLLNTVPDRGHWLLVHLEEVKTNRSGYGSVVELVRKDGTSVKAWVRGDGSYLAANIREFTSAWEKTSESTASGYTGSPANVRFGNKTACTGL
jgi:hypothetical protein